MSWLLPGPGSAGSRFVARDVKATNRPLALIVASNEPTVALAPDAPVALDTRTVVEATRSRRYTSGALSVSLGWRFVPWELNATKRPSAEIEPPPEPEFALTPVVPTDASVVVLATTSRTNTSEMTSPSLGWRFVDCDVK